MNRIIQWFHGLCFRTKIVMSFVLIGVVPFFVFSLLIVIQTGADLRKNDEHSFSSAFLTAAAKVDRQVEKVENAVEVLSVDSVVSNVLTAEPENQYEKYYQTTKHFDTTLQTILLTTPELLNFEFYVPNSLADVRINFHSMAALEKDINYAGLTEEGGGWFLENKILCVYRKIYNAYDSSRYAVLKAMVDPAGIIDPNFIENAQLKTALRGEPIYMSQLSGDTGSYMHLSREFMDGKGSIDVYKFSDSSLQTQTAMLLVVSATLGGFLILIALINVVSKLLVKRLSRLNMQLATAVENEFRTVLTEDYSDEIGQLTVTANKMISDTRRLIDDVYRSKLKQKEYEITALQAQLNPHFLYNVLSAINWHAIASDNMEISGIVTSLSKFYRTVLNKGQSVTDIENEMENIRAYVKIQSAIHSGSFDVEYKIEESVYGHYMPNLILQPIVENAIEHGIDHKTDGRGLLEIRAEKKEKYILFQIANNGAKIDGAATDKLLTHESRGYGISNVNKRLELFYGSDYELNFSSTELTIVTVKIPQDINRNSLLS